MKLSLSLILMIIHTENIVLIAEKIPKLLEVLNL